MRNSFVVVVAALATLASSACYRYAPAEPDALAPGQQVRARLTAEGSEALRASFGPDVTQVEGRFVAAEDAGLVLDVRRQVRAGDFPATTFDESLTLQPFQIESLEIREVDPLRTVAFSGALVVGTIAAVAGTKRLFGGGDEEAPPDDRVEGRWPIWILRLQVP